MTLYLDLSAPNNLVTPTSQMMSAYAAQAEMLPSFSLEASVVVQQELFGDDEVWAKQVASVSYELYTKHHVQIFVAIQDTGYLPACILQCLAPLLHSIVDQPYTFTS